jgi:capsular exopolysaccharide synthesis family protein
MSRVHEALSKARAKAGESSSSAEAGAPLYPIEGPEAAQADWASEAADTPAPETAFDQAADTEIQADGIDTEADNTMFEPRPRLMAEKLVLSANPDHASVEQYRRLAARLHLAQAEHGIKVVMVASALPGEGKTLTATNLALTLSESYQRDVLLIDGDLRRPSIHEMFRISNVSGLNDGLRSGADRKIPLVHWSEHLTLITAGRPDPDPMKVLVSQKMQKVIREAATKFQWVIIDTPPVGLLTDASLFSGMVDTAVLVIQAGRTPYASIQRAVEALGRERIFGVVLNRATTAASPQYAGYEYRYAAETAVPAKR